MNRRSLVLLAASLVLTIVSAASAACSQGGRTAVLAGVPEPSSEELEGRATAATGAPATRESQVRIWTIHYSAHNGADRLAYVILPASYGPGHDNPPLPLVISPHGRGGNGRTNAKLWGDLPAVGGFAVVNPDGMGRRLEHFSYGYPGQIDDLAKMPDFVTSALPWLQIDRRRIYALGSSMGGQETLLLVARHPRLLAGAAAMDSVTDMTRRYLQLPTLPCPHSCLQRWGRPYGVVLQSTMRREVGGTPEQNPRAYAARSPLSLAPAIAGSATRLQIWWSSEDHIVSDQKHQSAALLETLHRLNPCAPVSGVAGRWEHSKEMRSTSLLPIALLGFGLLPRQLELHPRNVQYLPAPSC
jgi:poly(3-hydroxybutyrate) depolymerase